MTAEASTVLDAKQADLRVFTFKEGLLRGVAHDLQIHARELELTLVGPPQQPEAVRLRVNPRSLVVVCAMRDGREDHGALSASDRAKIEATMNREVLHTQRFAGISFDSTRIERPSEHEAIVVGELLLHGVQRPLRAEVTQRGDRWITEVTLAQPQFGITPYSAMLGSLKVRPDVRVRLTVPASPA